MYTSSSRIYCGRMKNRQTVNARHLILLNEIVRIGILMIYFSFLILFFGTSTTSLLGVVC